MAHNMTLEKPFIARETEEGLRLAEVHRKERPWYLWGPYLSDRQWGTVREDYSTNGEAWNFLSHDQARSRAYRWGEEGLLGLSDDQCRMCFALSMWNGADPILKERLFGLTGSEGNHGEDVKEYYYFLDNTPTHSYMKALYKYPQQAFPYNQLVEENRRRGRDEPEYELIDTGIFAEERYFDVTVEYAKVNPDDTLMRITAQNCSAEPAPFHLLPTLWFRNTWTYETDEKQTRPRLQEVLVGEGERDGYHLVQATHSTLGEYWLACQNTGQHPHLLFTENETNAQRLWKIPNTTDFVKDGINDAVVNGACGTVNPEQYGTKAALHYTCTLAPGMSETFLLRLSATRQTDPFADATAVFDLRQAEADHFYEICGTQSESEDRRLVQRQAFAGLLWSKQFYYYDVEQWLQGDAGNMPPPEARKAGRNREWKHLNNADIISMPDAWEYPWYAAWDLAFHCIALAQIDLEFAKQQLILLLYEWYMHPNGQLPAYEWNFSDVNPPVHAWAAWYVYSREKSTTGRADRDFLERVFHKLLLNFTWWVNRKDSEGHNIFQGGFLGLDNIGIFDRSSPLPTGGMLEQSDGTAWMGMYSLNMLAISLELARENHVYEEVATKFFEHFLNIAGALNNIGNQGISLWNEDDQCFYDVLHLPDDSRIPLKVHSLVGFIPLLAVETLEPALLEDLPAFKQRLEWFMKNRPELASLVACWQQPGAGERRLLSIVHGHRMKELLKRMLDPDEFLGDYGIRGVSKYHADHPYCHHVDGVEYSVTYEPGESRSGLFGGNSNWRGPIWFPINFLLIETLLKFHHYYGDDFLVECPTGSQQMLTLKQISEHLAERLSRIFLRGSDGRRPVFGQNEFFQTRANWRDYPLFYEYFHGDLGTGLGASHQTGWTALVVRLLEETL